MGDPIMKTTYGGSAGISVESYEIDDDFARLVAFRLFERTRALFGLNRPTEHQLHVVLSEMGNAVLMVRNMAPYCASAAEDVSRWKEYGLDVHATPVCGEAKYPTLEEAKANAVTIYIPTKED